MGILNADRGGGETETMIFCMRRTALREAAKKGGIPIGHRPIFEEKIILPNRQNYLPKTRAVAFRYS